jgi:tRNA(fMet)-specific endonuclease VapC
MIPSGNGLLLDTSVVIDHFRGDSRVSKVLESTTAIYMPTIVLGELYYGAFRSAQPEKHLAQLSRFLRVVAILGVDAQTSKQYGLVHAELAQAGAIIPGNDIWIAAVAIQHGLPVATRDQHFARIAGLQIVLL